MAVNVTVNSRINRVTTKSPTAATRVTTSVTNPSKTQTATTIAGLAGVDVADAQDGETLVYNASTGNWEAAPAADVAANIQTIDGGTFG